MKFDIIISLIICLAPFLIFFHLMFSEGTSTFQFVGFEYPHRYYSNQVFMWSMLISLIPLILALVIYFTTVDSWRYFLFPILIFLFFSTLIVIIDCWEQHSYYVNIVELFWILIFIENILFYDHVVFKKYRSFKLKITRKDLWKELVYKDFTRINRKVRDTLLTKNLTSLHQYICRIYFILQVLNEKVPDEAKGESDESFGNYFTKSDYAKGISLTLIFLLLFSYTIIPANIDKIDFKLFEIGNFGFKSVYVFIWYSSHRLSLLILFLWCLIQCDHWWRWALLSPIVFYGYQLWELFSRMNVDEMQDILRLSPVLFILIIIFLLAKSISRQYKTLYYKTLLAWEFEEKIKEAAQVGDHKG